MTAKHQHVRLESVFMDVRNKKKKEWSRQQ